VWTSLCLCSGTKGLVSRKQTKFWAGSRIVSVKCYAMVEMVDFSFPNSVETGFSCLKC